MIEIACKKTKFIYNVYHITKAFFPDEEIVQKVDEKQESLVELKLPGGSCFSLAPEDIAGELAENAGGRPGAQAVLWESCWPFGAVRRYSPPLTPAAVCWPCLPCFWASC